MNIPPRRSFPITLVLLLLIFLGALQIARVVALSEQSALLLELQVKPDPRIRLIAAAGWTVLFWAAAIALWRRIPITRVLAPLLLVCYSLYELVVLALYAQVPISEQRWILYSIIGAVFTLFCYWALNRSAARSYYLEEDPVDGQQ